MIRLKMRNICALICLFAAHFGQAKESPPKNVLFIMIDDLRPELGCYGSTVAKTPSIDRLAESGTRFDRAYVSVAICAPSREAVLTGLRPSSNGCYSIPDGPYWKRHPQLITLPDAFREAGYTAVGLGKIVHNGAEFINAEDWTRYSDPKAPGTKNAGKPTQETVERNKGIQNPSVQIIDAPDDTFGDGMLARVAAEEIKSLGKAKKPFFLAVGFRKPHLKFIAPKKYFDLYESTSVPISKDQSFPKNLEHWDVPGGAQGEVLAYGDQKREWEQAKANGKVVYSDDFQRWLNHGYLACTSFVDAQVGVLLDAVETSGLAENTIIVLWSDHGYHLGDLSLWGKHQVFEDSVRVPLIIRAPGVGKPGQVVSGLVESVDLYQTITDLARVRTPQGLEGVSLAPLLHQPDLQWKKAAWSEYKGKKIMGENAYTESIRTDRYRYVEHRALSDRSRLLAVELYDYQNGLREAENIAPVQPKLAQELSSLMARGWKAAAPQQ